MKYVGQLFINGSSFPGCYESNDKNKLVADMRTIAEGNCTSYLSDNVKIAIYDRNGNKLYSAVKYRGCKRFLLR